MSNSSEDEIEFGESYKNVDLESYKCFFEHLKGNNTYIKKQQLLNFINAKGISIDDNRLKTELK